MAKQQSMEVEVVQAIQDIALPEGYQPESIETVLPPAVQRTPYEMLSYDQFTLLGYELADTQYGPRIVWHCMTADGPCTFTMGIVLDSSNKQYDGKMNAKRLTLMEKFDKNARLALTGCCVVAVATKLGNAAYDIVSKTERDANHMFDRPVQAPQPQMSLPRVEEDIPF